MADKTIPLITLETARLRIVPLDRAAIDEKLQERIFEPGFTTKRTGQGMGLYIVSQTVAGLGGRITLESKDGDTVFSGFVPRTRLQLSNSTESYEQKSKNGNETSV